MAIIWWILGFVFGYVLIYLAAEFLIEEIIETLEKFQISPVAFGIIFLGIELEESSASIFAAANGLALLSIGNLIGNSIIAIFLTFSIPFFFLKVKQELFPVIFPSLLIFTIVNILIAFLLPSYFFLSTIIAILTFLVVIAYSLYLQSVFVSSYTEEESNDPPIISSEDDEDMTAASLALRIVSGLLLIFVGGQVLTVSAEKLIELSFLTETFFGLVIMAFVTNGEELFLMLSALRRGQYQLGLSAQFGKLLWNLTLVYGISGLIIGSFSAPAVFLTLTILLLITAGIILYLVRSRQFSSMTSLLFALIFVIFILVSFSAL